MTSNGGRDVGSVPANTPVLVGVGAEMQREDDPRLAAEPLDLMERAALAAGAGSGVLDLLRDLQVVLVPKGRWRYRDPGRVIAERLGATRVATVIARVGVLQEKLIGEACNRILAGEAQVVMVVGGDCGYRLLRARITGHELSDAVQETEPDAVWSAPEPILSPAEISGGLGDAAPAYYAVIDSALRARRADPIDAHRTALAELYSGFSQIAADNPHAWRRSPVDPESIRGPSDRNPMIAFPYTKLHTSDWSVDQASALLLCSAGKAREVGVPADRWVFPMVSSISDHMLAVSERTDISRCPGAEIAARSTLDHGGVAISDVGLLDLYSCFPAAVLTHAEALGLGPAPTRPLTFTGGMRFAGGPFNNYVLHTTAQLALRLRASGNGVGLVSSVSGVLTKHAFSLWGTTPNAEYRFLDVTSEVERATQRKNVVEGYLGTGEIAGYTVHTVGKEPLRVVAVIDTDGGDRALASTTDERTVAAATAADLVGRQVSVADGHLVLEGVSS